MAIKILPYNDWRVDPRKDRRASECKTRNMRRKDWEQYGPKTNIERNGIIGVKYIKNHNYIRRATDEEIIEAAKKHGTSLNGIRTIAKEFGYVGPSSIQERVRRLTRNE